MRKLFLLLALFFGCCTTRVADAAPVRKGAVITFRGAINEETGKKLAATLIKVQLDGEPALLVIDSPGGDLDVTKRLITLIQGSRTPVYCLVDGDGASAAFELLQACTTRGATVRSQLMTHEALTEFDKDSQVTIRDLRDIVNNLEAATMAMVRFEANRMHMDPIKLRAKIANGPWQMDAGEALKTHAIDYVASSLAAAKQSFSATGKPSP